MAGPSTRKVIENATLEYTIYMEGLFWAKGNWEETGTEKKNLSALSLFV